MANLGYALAISSNGALVSVVTTERPDFIYRTPEQIIVKVAFPSDVRDGLRDYLATFYLPLPYAHLRIDYSAWTLNS